MYYTVCCSCCEDLVIDIFDSNGEYEISHYCKDSSEVIDWLDQHYPDSLPATVAPPQLFNKIIECRH